MQQKTRSRQLVLNPESRFTCAMPMTLPGHRGRTIAMIGLGQVSGQVVEHRWVWTKKSHVVDFLV